MSDNQTTAKENITSQFPQTLLGGYARFKTSGLVENRERLQHLAEKGQKPETMVICCCDSRAAPETIFDAAPGDIFVVRNVANIVPPHEAEGDNHSVSSALEFAVQALGVKHVVVMGHARCGGIAAFRQKITGDAMAPLSEGNFVGKWINLLDPVEQRIERVTSESAEDLQRKIEEQNIAQSVENLRTFPFISSRIENDELSVHGAWFDISNGALWTMDAQTGSFEQPAK